MPVAISWSTARITSTDTPCRSMIPIERSASAWVLETSGERFNVQLMKSAERSEKSHSWFMGPTDSPARRALQQGKHVRHAVHHGVRALLLRQARQLELAVDPAAHEDGA